VQRGRGAPGSAVCEGKPALDVRTGELADACFPDQEFDVVYMNEVIEHIVDPVALMREVHRVLRPAVWRCFAPETP